jgi:hypothetical protein
LPSIKLSRAVWVPIDRKTGLAYAVPPGSRFLPWHLLTLFPGFREPDRYCLLPAFDLATFSSSPAFRSATLVTSHLTFNVTAGAVRIFPLSFLSHRFLIKNDLCQSPNHFLRWRLQFFCTTIACRFAGRAGNGFCHRRRWLRKGKAMKRSRSLRKARSTSAHRPPEPVS